MQESNRSGRNVYIVDGARTPFLKMRGVPGAFSASDLAIGAGRNLLANQPFSPTRFDQVVVGCVSPSEEEANIGRVISLRLGCGHDTPAWTVQRNCASGLQAVDSGFQSIKSGRCDLVLAGGCETMSRAPLLFSRQMVRWLAELQGSKTVGKKLKAAIRFRPGFLTPVIAILKGLTDPIVNLSMGQTAEELAYRFGISKEEMDAFAVQSHQKALIAQNEGLLNKEINPIFSWDGKSYEQDDGVRSDSSAERLAKLRPVFDKYGNITAGNSSQISDGAAFLVLASEKAVDEHKLNPIAKVVDVHWAGLDPSIMGLGPAHAIAPLLNRNQIRFDQVDHLEINEAFAVQVLACMKVLADDKYCQKHFNMDSALGEFDLKKLNPEGGAVAIGHPVGASGARISLHTANMLAQRNQRYGVASLCIGGGQGGAILLENASGAK